MRSLRVAIGPKWADFIADAVSQGGGTPVEAGEPAEALVWMRPHDPDGLPELLKASTDIRWVQLPTAGVEAIVATGIIDSSRTWTCAKGAYAEPVAEHALALGLGGLRQLALRARARSWGSEAGLMLWDSPVTILGGGGITRALLPLLAPFRTEVTVVRRDAEPVPGAARTLDTSRLHESLEDARLVVLALALSPETMGIIGAEELALMGSETWLVNVARGKHVQTDALVDALKEGRLGGAGLDVTDPEPLPEGHPLWDLDNCIITPHTADTKEMSAPLLAARVRQNVERYLADQPLMGKVDPALGY